MLKRHAIQVLRAAGHGQSETATLTDVSIRSVRRVEAEADICHVDDAGERNRRRIGRPSTAEPFRSLVVEVLAQDRHCCRSRFSDAPSCRVIRAARVRSTI